MKVEVAYTEALQVNSGQGSIHFGFLDTMNGSAHLESHGGGMAVDGLDGAASLRSHGGHIQVTKQSTTRVVQSPLQHVQHHLTSAD